PNRAEAMQKIAEQQKEREQQMKEVLGDEKFAQLQDYNQTVGERMMLEQFGRDVEVTPEQKEQLLGIVLEEKKNMQINLGAEALNANKDPQSVISSPELMEKMLTQQKQVNERVLERASTVLTADQVRKLGPLLDSQIEMQRAGAKMAQQMFGGSGNAE